ncbi:uncharacterized protein [Atheta coriaria]|uniref:uncharacterized protein n=1 Tax=Dalotia coriaria TaxID=877792 RepID=UPI0031F40FD4
MFASAAVIFLQNLQQDDTTLSNHQQRFNKLLQDIQQISYKVHIHHLREDTDLETTLTEFLKLHDIVITIGNLTEELFTAVAKVYDEHWTDDCKETSREINEDSDSSEYKYFQIITEQQNHILKLHRFYFIESDCVDLDFTQLLKQLNSFTRKPVYSKVFHYNKSDKRANEFVDKLISRENGVRCKKLTENEVIVSSGSIEEINALHQHFVDSYEVENSFVLDEYEEEILNSPCIFIQEAIQYIKECFDLYKPENVFICFNGGKDCTVLLHLMMLILRTYYSNFNRPVFCMYVQSKKPFPQVTAFIDKLKKYYNLDVHTLTLGIKDGLAAILQDKPNLKACLMGTRRSDPFSANLRHFQATDNGWPEIMRVSPLLDWEFAHVWDYLLSFKVPYCCLYDEGYTSLGNVDNTLKNPQLLNEDTGAYYPAYRLLKSTKERSGRM